MADSGGTGGFPRATRRGDREIAGINRRRATTVLLVLATAGALAGTLASLGHVAWWLELFSHFRPQYALLLAACGIGLAVLGRPAVGLAALALSAANALPLLHYYTGVSEPPATGPGFKAVLANVYFRNASHDGLLDYVRAVEPDVAVFLEVTPAWSDSLRGLAVRLPFQAQANEVFVASRTPLTGLRVLPLGEQGTVAMVFSVDAGGTPLTVIATHANWPLGAGIAASRDRELALLADAARDAPRPVLVLGDLNTTAFSPVFTRLLGTAGLSDCAAGRGFHPTWPAWFPPLYIQIDHCLADPGLEVNRLATGPFIGSDHYPLEVTLTLRSAGLPRQPGVSASLERPTSRR